MQFPKKYGLLLLVALSIACSSINTVFTPPTPLPTITPIASRTPAPSPTPSPAPTPTPLPAVRIETAEQALFLGDWERASQEFNAALQNAGSGSIQNAALLGLGRTYYLSGDYESAEQMLRRLTSEAEAMQNDPAAYFYLGEVYNAQERYREAAEAYLIYLSARPGVIDAYLYERRADALLQAGEYSAAITDYQAALASSRLGGDLSLEIKTARAYALSGDYATAIVAYQDIYSRTEDLYLRAQMDWLMGQAYQALGQNENAAAAYQDAILYYPQAYDSYNALLALLELGQPVDEYARGLVDYYSGHYGVAVEAFDRYLEADPADPGAARYFKGLSLSALGDPQAAIAVWEESIASHPESAYWDDAWEEIAFTQWYSFDLFDEAVATSLEFVKTVPDHPRAAQFLFDAGLIAERNRDLQEAALLWERLPVEYPGSDLVGRSRFLGGIARYRLKEYTLARQNFEQILPTSADAGERAAAIFWAGKSQAAAGDELEAQRSWARAAETDPTGYYSERAAELLTGGEPFAPPADYVLTYDLAAERREADAWVRTVFALPQETDFNDLSALQADGRYLRGRELWQLGLYDEARLEFESLRQSLLNDALNTYRLSGVLLELGLYRSAILAARQVLTLAGMDDAASRNAPIYFNHIRFGVYYRELIVPAAQEYDFHPLFLLSVMRQESLFEGFVRSSAGARGLMQIIPSTGEEMARFAGWPPNFTAADLYRPIVSVRLGCEYLDRQRAYLDGDVYAMLAAYNGGPGNASRWQDLANGDPDLFVEVVRFQETRNYIRGIYEIYDWYKAIYSLEP